MNIISRNDISLSVVVPCFNAENTISDFLETATKQTLPRDQYEIIIIDDGSSDKTTDIISHFKDVILACQKRQGPGTARNKGTSMARAPLVLYLDSDLRLSPDLMEKHVAYHLAHDDIAATGGSVSPATALPVFSWLLADHLSSWWNAHPRISCATEPEYLPSLNFCIKKHTVCVATGLQWEDGLSHTGEDVIFCHELRRRGLRMAFLNDARVFHHDRTTFTAYCRHMRAWGYHAPFVRGRIPGLKFGFLFPDSIPLFLMLSPIVILGYTWLIWKSWSRAYLLRATLAIPQLIIGRIAYVCGVIAGLRNKLRNK